MERLTEKHYAEKGYYMKCSETCEKRNCDTCDSMADIVDRLGAYEDAEEQGLLVRLPCKVGDTVYSIDINTDACDNCPEESNFYGMDKMCGSKCFYDAIKSMECKKLFKEVTEKTFDFWFWHLYSKDFQKTWWITREEAEAALAKEGGA